MAEATNRNRYLLAVVTTVLLPTTVVTGLRGMNTGSLPFEHDDHGFVWVGFLVFGSILLSFALLRSSRVF